MATGNLAKLFTWQLPRPISASLKTKHYTHVIQVLDAEHFASPAICPCLGIFQSFRHSRPTMKCIGEKRHRCGRLPTGSVKHTTSEVRSAMVPLWQYLAISCKNSKRHPVELTRHIACMRQMINMYCICKSFIVLPYDASIYACRHASRDEATLVCRHETMKVLRRIGRSLGR